MSLRFPIQITIQNPVIWWRTIDMKKMNDGFSFGFFAFSALLGSVSSVFLSSAFVWGLVRLWQKKLKRVEHKHIILVAAIFALFPAAELLSTIVNQRGTAAIGDIAGSVLFLSVLPVTSRLMISPPQSIINSVGLGAAFSGIGLFVYSMSEFIILGVSRPEAGLGNPSILAAFALTICCICISFLKMVPDKWRTVLMAGVICSFCAMVLASTRAVWMAAPLVIIATGWHLLRMNLNTQWTLTLNHKFFSMLAAAVFLVPMMTILIYKRISTTIESFQHLDVMTSDVSIGQRFSLWSGGWEQVKASWLFGYGPNSTSEMILALGGDNPVAYTHYHNLFLTSLIRGGMIELAAVLLVIGVLIWVVLQKSENAFQIAGRRLILGIVIATVLPAMFGILFSHDILNAVFLYSTIVGLTLSIATVETQQSAEQPSV